MRALAAVLLLVAVPVLAGCTAPGPSGPEAAPIAPAPTALVYDGAWNVRTPDAGLLSTFASFDLGHDGAEPTLGVTSSGSIFVISDATVLKSVDGGITWQDVSPVVNFPTSLDPYIYVDPATDRIFVDHLYLGCSYLAFSDDEGATWVSNPAACGLPGNDHQTVAAGKPRGILAPMLTYPSVVYYGYNDIVRSTSSVARSVTGGASFEPAVVAVDAAHCGGLNGHFGVAPDGTLYLPAHGCENPVIAVSTDSGATWAQSVVPGDKGHAAPGEDPAIAVDSAGNAFLIWSGKDALMYGSISTDAGKTWGEPFHLSPPSVTSSLFPTAAAGDAGRVAFAYYATSDPTDEWKTVNSDDATEKVRWHLFVTYSLDALRGADATYVTVQVTPDADPIQIGRIHNGGGGDPARNLLDFIDVIVDGKGRIMAAYTDGCTEGCTSPETSRSRATSFATLREGPSLLDGVGRLAP